MKTLGVLFLISVTAALRLIPHPANFSPLGAMALFGGATLVSWRSSSFALLAPLAALFLSDFVLGFHDQMPAVYGAYLLIGVLGIYLGRNPSVLRWAGGAFAASFIFFVVTNLSVWWFSGMYERSSEGLSLCFVQALPFFGNQIVGDLFFTAVLFGSWALIEVRREERA